MNIFQILKEKIYPNRKYKDCIENYFARYLEDKNYSKSYNAKSNEYLFENQYRFIKICNQTHPSDYGFSVFLYNKLRKGEYSILIHIPNYHIYPDFFLIRSSFYALLADKKTTDSIETSKWNRNLKVFWIKENSEKEKKIVRIA